MNRFYEIERCVAGHPDWVGSFSERLYEDCEWNIDEFWKLHRELVKLALFLRDKNKINKDLVEKLLDIQSTVWNSIASHFNDNDVVRITGITDAELHQFLERFKMAIAGVTSGQVLPEEKFDLVNPLM